MHVILDGRKMTDKEATHIYLKERLHFPDYYGKNLDALFDCLTEVEETVEIRVEHPDDMRRNLSEYADALLVTFRDAAAENPNLQLTETE